MSMRESFEKWAVANNYEIDTVETASIRTYFYSMTDVAWTAYQTAYNMQQAVIDELQSSLDTYAAREYDEQMSAE